ncbi:hypothetical protein AB0G04_25150 [Actinoplanes sp. NPDC023801]|uniref:hypothetical protein n=1 Tax=Actinoplanes sp. NPDC023801 TaxID=3154595 RepID=UPI0033C4FCB1
MMSSRLWTVAATTVLLLSPAVPAAAAPTDPGLSTAYLDDWGRGGYLNDSNERGDVVGTLNDENVNTQPVVWPRDGAPVRIGVDRGYPTAVNELGDVVGDNWLWSNGQLRTLAGPSRQMRAVDINDRRQVTGTIDPDSSGVDRMFLWQDGRFTTFGPPAGMRGHPLSVNNRGEVLGYLTNASWSVQQGFVWRAGRMTILKPLLGGNALTPRAINDRGQVVGYSTVAGSEVLHAFSWQDGRMRDLTAGHPAEAGLAWDVNNAGDVVGNIGSKAVLWRGGKVVDLAVPGQYTYATQINERGDVAGWATSGDPAQNRVFRWRDNRVVFSEGYNTVMGLSLTGIDGSGRVVGMIDDLVFPPRPARWVAEAR